MPYDEVYLSATAKELKEVNASGKYPHVTQMVVDYGQLRRACRAVEKGVTQ